MPSQRHGACDCGPKWASHERGACALSASRSLCGTEARFACVTSSPTTWMDGRTEQRSKDGNSYNYYTKQTPCTQPRLERHQGKEMSRPCRMHGFTGWTTHPSSQPPPPIASPGYCSSSAAPHLHPALAKCPRSSSTTTTTTIMTSSRGGSTAEATTYGKREGGVGEGRLRGGVLCVVSQGCRTLKNIYVRRPKHVC